MAHPLIFWALLLASSRVRDVILQKVDDWSASILAVILNMTSLDEAWNGHFRGKHDELAAANRALYALVVFTILYLTIGTDDDPIWNKLSSTIGNKALFMLFVTADLGFIGYLFVRPKRSVILGGHHEVALSMTNADLWSMLRWSDPDSLQTIKQYPPFEKWCKKMEQFVKGFHHCLSCENQSDTLKNKFDISRIEVQWVDMDNSRITGLKLQAAVDLVETKMLVSGGKPKKVPGIVLMGDPSVAVLMLVAVESENECKLYVATVQRSRIAVPCTCMREIPSKTVADPENFLSEATALVRGIQGFEDEEVIDMTELAYCNRKHFEGIYPTVGASNEYVRIFVSQKKVSVEEFSEIKSATVCLDGLDLQLHMTRYSYLPFECADMKAICAVALYERLKTIHRLECLSAERDVEPPKEKARSGVFQGSNGYAAKEVSRMVLRNSNLSQRKENVSLVDDASEDDNKIKRAINAVKFKEWEAKLADMNESASDSSPSPEILEIEAQSIDFFGDTLGFFKFNAAAKINLANDTFRQVSGNVFMRGSSVGILVLLQCGEDLFTVVTRQARVAVGDPDFVEIPAGMTDSYGNTSFATVAMKELLEETRLKANGDLVDMTEKMMELLSQPFRGYYPACDKSDEYNRFFLQYYTMTEADLSKYKLKCERACGNFREGEIIQTQIIPYQDLWKESADAKALCALYMYETLHRLGKLPLAPRPKLLLEGNPLLKKLKDGDGEGWFDQFDDGDGILDREEMKKGLLETFSKKRTSSVVPDGLTSKKLQIIIDWFLVEYDHNNDNKFGRDEFKKSLRQALINWTEAHDKEIEVGDKVLQCRVKLNMLGHVEEVDKKKEYPIRLQFQYTRKRMLKNSTYVIGEDSFKENELILIEKAKKHV